MPFSCPNVPSSGFVLLAFSWHHFIFSLSLYLVLCVLVHWKLNLNTCIVVNNMSHLKSSLIDLLLVSLDQNDNRLVSF